jgi:hypothetical protein
MLHETLRTMPNDEFVRFCGVKKSTFTAYLGEMCTDQNLKSLLRENFRFCTVSLDD